MRPSDNESTQETRLGFTGRKLTQATLEAALRGSSLYVKDQGWSLTENSPLLVDLSRVEWVDLSAAARLVAFIEGALKTTIKTRVALPLPRRRASEARFEAESSTGLGAGVSQRVERRRRALEFLDACGFLEAVACRHIPGASSLLTVIHDFDPSAGPRSDGEDAGVLGIDVENPSPAEREDAQQKLLRNLLPLTWLSQPEDRDSLTHLQSLARYVTQLARERGSRISRLDASALANVLFYELVNNVRDHAGSSHCLVAAWCREGTQPVHGDEYLEPEKEFFEGWIGRNRWPLIELVFVDSGEGIPNHLRRAFSVASDPKDSVPPNVESEEGQILFWSLGRWTSSKTPGIRRGTRGLFRVRRLTRAYRGMLTLRSDTALVGWDNGGIDLEQPFWRRGMTCVPGTFVSIRLPGATLEPPEPNVRTGGDVSRTVSTLNGETWPDDVTTDLELETLAAALGSHGKEAQRCVVYFPAVSSSPGARKARVEELIRRSVDVANPGALLLAFPDLSPKELGEAVESVNSEPDEARSIDADAKHYSIQNPVGVLDRDGRILWAGVGDTERNALSSLHATLSSSSGADVGTLVPDEHRRLAFVIWARQHRALLRETATGGFAPRFLGGDVLDGIERDVETKLSSALRSSSKSVRVGRFMLPILIIVNRLVDFGALLAPISPRAIAYALALKIRRTLRSNDGLFNALVTDSSASEPIVRATGQMLVGDPQVVVVAAADESISIAESWDIRDDTRAIVYTNILLGWDSAAHLLSEVFRSGATVEAVACVVDGRPVEQQGQPLEWLGVQVPVVSLITSDFVEIDQKSIQNVTVLDAVATARGGRENTLYREPDESRYPIKPADVKEWVARTSALQFNHVARPIGRHFTFFLNAAKLLAADGCAQAFHSAAQSAFEMAIRDIGAVSPPEAIRVFYPTGGKEAQAYQLARDLASRIGCGEPLGFDREAIGSTWMFSSTISTPEAVNDIETPKAK